MVSICFRRDTLPEDVARLFGEGMPPPLVPTTEGNAPPPPAPPAVRNMPLDTLPADCLFTLHQHVPVQLILRLVCKAMRDAHGRTKTQLCDVVVSPKLAQWARSVGYPTQEVGTGVMARKAVAGGHKDTLVYLRSQRVYPHVMDLDLCRLACYHGQLEMLQWLRARDPKVFQWDGHCTHVAAQNGHLETLKWARQNGAPFHQGALDAATRGNHYQCVQWLLVHDNGRVTSETFRLAAANGSLEMLKLLAAYEDQTDSGCVVEAAHQGHLACLKFLVIDMQAYYTYHSLMSSAVNNPKLNMDVVNFVLTLFDADEFGAPFQNTAITLAAERGHVEVLELARRLGCWGGDFTMGVCAGAAANGELETLKWLRKHGCEWDEMVCEQAAEFGELEALKWAREQGCPWDFHTVECAVVGGNLETVQWICGTWDKGPAGCLPFRETDSHPQDLNRALPNRAARHGHAEVLVWLIANGCEYDMEHLQLAVCQHGSIDGEPPCGRFDRNEVRDFLRRLEMLRESCGPGFERFLRC